MTRPRVLIIDDDERLNTLLTEYLDRFGFSVQTASHPNAGLRVLKADPPDLLILDVMLPETDGLAVCRQIRETSRIPIIMLTARGGVTDRVLGLELGADDYMPKPFEPRELVARIQAVLRRSHKDDSNAVRVGTLDVNWATRSAHLEGRPLAQTTAEFELLGFLVRNRGRVVSRERTGTRTIGPSTCW